MSEYNRVAWGEGMYLAPQHFQQHDRFLENMTYYRMRHLVPYYWGISELAVDTKLLDLGKFGLSTAKGILPDGTVFNMPMEDENPKPIDIVPAMQNKRVYLAIPLYRNGQTSMSFNEKDLQHRYHVKSKEILDTVDGNEEIIEVPIARLQLQFLIEGEDLSHYAAIPIAFIKSVSKAGVKLDKKFIPACLDVSAATGLSELVTQIQGLLQHRGNMLADRLNEEQYSETAIAIDFMLLQLINRYEPYFQHLQKKSLMHPEEFFSNLLRLYGELTTFSDQSRRPDKQIVYQHDDLQSCFSDVMESLYELLSMVLEKNATLLELEKRGDNTWLASLQDKQLLEDSYFVLAVYADLPADTIRESFAKQTKIAPVEQLKNLIAHQLPGIDLDPMPVAPRQIPYHANHVYFKLNKKHDSWQYLSRSAALALHVSGKMPSVKLELWAIKE